MLCTLGQILLSTDPSFGLIVICSIYQNTINIVYANTTNISICSISIYYINVDT